MPCSVAEAALPVAYRPGNGMPSLVNHSGLGIRQQPGRRSAGRIQRDAVKGRLVHGAEAAVAAKRSRRRSQLPLVLAAVEVGVRAAFDKAVEATDGVLERGAIDPKF